MRYADPVATRIAIMPLDELVQLVNEWGTLPRQFDGRADTPADPELTTLADELHPIFAAEEPASTAGTGAPFEHQPAGAQPQAGNRASATRAAQVTALLERTGVRPVLTTGDSGGLVQAWLVDDPAQALRAAAALALREQLAERPGRIGTCADRQCADVYVDLSPAGRRRFCCLTCQNRARAEAFRKRHQST
jgi:hypothetical protein